MATFLSDQLNNVNKTHPGFPHRNHPSESYGKVTSFNVTLNSSGSYATGTTPAAVTYATGDIIQLACIKTVDKVRSIKLLDQLLTGNTGLTFNVGLAYGTVATTNPINGAANPRPGTIANATAYASSDADIQTAHTAPVELAYLNRAPGAVNNFAWQDAGLTENPGGTLIIVLQVTAGSMDVGPDQVAFLIDVINT